MSKEPKFDKTLLITLLVMAALVVIFLVLPEPAPWALPH
jgi:hypothetical protein